MQWLRTDLALYGKKCTLAYWHEPRFVSGVNITSNPKYQTLWDTLYAYGADVVLNGHKHSYERLAPQSPSQRSDTLYGIRAFVVGTGGTGLDGGSPPPVPNSEVRNTTTWGVLKLTLNTGGYSWQFIPVAGQSFADHTEIEYATQVATAQLNRHAQPWVWGRPAPPPRQLRHRFVYCL